jgi:hypothetical protein
LLGKRLKDEQERLKKDSLLKIQANLTLKKTGDLFQMKKVIVLSTVLGLGALGMACGDAAPANNAANANKTNTNAVVTNTNTAANTSVSNAAANAANTVANAAANAANAVANAANTAANKVANAANANHSNTNK